MTHLCSLATQRNTSQLNFSWQNDWLRNVCAPVMRLPVALQDAAACTVTATFPECNRQLACELNQSKFHSSCHHIQKWSQAHVSVDLQAVPGEPSYMQMRCDTCWLDAVIETCDSCSTALRLSTSEMLSCQGAQCPPYQAISTRPHMQPGAHVIIHAAVSCLAA